MNIKKQERICIIKLAFYIFIFLIITIKFTSAWHVIPKGDHGELTKQALIVVQNNDTNGNYNELYSTINRVTTSIGANLIDFSKHAGIKPANKPGYINFDYSHFYHPNGSSYNNLWPSALNESYDWLKEAIEGYAKGNIIAKGSNIIDKRIAYMKLGFMMHLLEDAAVPAHSHLVHHGENLVDYLEYKADADAFASNCYYEVAIKKKDLTLCESAGAWKKKCIETIKEN